MSAFFALIRRDLRLTLRAPGEVLTLILFFVMIGVTVPFAIGPDKVLLARLAPGIVWIAALLSALLALDRLFRPDQEDGSLRALRHADISLEAVALAKLIAYWLTTALPLMLATPLLAVMMNMDMALLWRSLVSLAIGTPGLAAFGTFGAALTVSLRYGGLIAPVLILPLSIPILIFGASAAAGGALASAGNAALLLLAGLSLAITALSPFAIALALRLSED